MPSRSAYPAAAAGCPAERYTLGTDAARLAWYGLEEGWLVPFYASAGWKARKKLNRETGGFPGFPRNDRFFPLEPPSVLVYLAPVKKIKGAHRRRPNRS